MLKTVTDFIVENQGLVAFGAAALLAIAMDHLWAFRRGWEACCRSFAARSLDETRSKTSVRL